MADWEDGDDDKSDDAINPKEPKAAKGWLAIIKDAEKVFRDYQEKSDNIDKLYANLERLANTARDRQFQMFWANIAVLGPSIYSRPPIPVVVPRFRDRRPLHRVASELLERSSIVSFEMECIDQIMRQVRDDLTVIARGTAWVRYEAKSKGENLSERVCLDYKSRKDFLHDPARTWKEVDWVASRSFLTRQEMRKRFRKSSGDEYKKAAYEVRKDDNGDDDGRKKAAVWEIWSKSEKRVVWVSEGCEKLLDDDKPHLELEGFFPCPKPAYATVQRGTLIPVPDMVFYKDQLEEINDLTARIAALADAVKVRGFYPAGAGEIGDAVEAAINNTSDNKVLVGISNWAMVGSGGVKDMIVWLPIEMVTKTISDLVALRRQLIDDVYQITGLSDIMRGSTEASETLGAQQLKSQYGSIRIRDRQEELIRFARDLTRITAEIMAENFQGDTLLDMSQMEIESDADIAKQVKPLKEQVRLIEADIRKAQSDPEVMQMAKAEPEKAQQIMQQAQQQIVALTGQIEDLEEKPTIENVMKLLRDQRVRPFALDIETDSTIAPDENAQKQRATEFITAVGGFMGQALPLVQTMPEAMPLAGNMLKYVASQFRAGRELDSTIDEFVDKLKESAGQPKPNPEADKAAADAQAKQADMQLRQQALQADQQAKAADEQRKQQQAMFDAQLRQSVEQANQAREDQRLQADLAAKDAEAQRKVQLMGADDARNAELHQQQLELNTLAIEKLKLEIGRVQVQTEATIATTEAGIDATTAKTAAGIEAQAAKTKFNGEARP